VASAATLSFSVCKYLSGFFHQGFSVLDEEAFLGVTYGRQFDLDLQRQRFRTSKTWSWR
jgi:hypothetical protein